MFPQATSKLRTLRPNCLRRRGSDARIIRRSVRWSPGRRLFFGDELLFAARIIHAFYRNTGRCPLREARVGLSEKCRILYAVVSSSIEPGDISYRVSRGGGHVRRKTVGGSPPLGRPISACFQPGPVRRIRLHWSLMTFPNSHKKWQRDPDQATLVGWGRHPPYRRGILSASTHNGVVGTARATREACALRSPRRVSSGCGAQRFAEGVA